MYPVIEEAVKVLGIADQIDALRAAAKRSESYIADSRRFLIQELPPVDIPLDVVVLGSIARREASTESDFDFLVIAYELPKQITKTREVLLAVDRLREKLGLAEPGRRRLFGRVVAAADLTERIGLEQDTNLTHSQRILLLEESVSIYQPDRHRQLVRSILDRYLADYDNPKHGVARFLLNDVLRYWRTLTVDYQAKRWEDLESDWGLRYLKLILSRKVAFAGTLASLLLAEESTIDYLFSQFEMPPLARLVQIHTVLEPALQGHLREAILISNEFAMKLADADFRDAARAVSSRADVKEGTDFARLQDRARALQRALEAVFFDSDRLGERSRRYLSF